MRLKTDNGWKVLGGSQKTTHQEGRSLSLICALPAYLLTTPISATGPGSRRSAPNQEIRTHGCPLGPVHHHLW